jgi:hypothetical protein
MFPNTRTKRERIWFGKPRHRTNNRNTGKGLLLMVEDGGRNGHRTDNGLLTGNRKATRTDFKEELANLLGISDRIGSEPLKPVEPDALVKDTIRKKRQDSSPTSASVQGLDGTYV